MKCESVCLFSSDERDGTGEKLQTFAVIDEINSYTSGQNVERNIMTVHFGLSFLKKRNIYIYIYIQGVLRKCWTEDRKDLQPYIERLNGKHKTLFGPQAKL
jgi:hypothetical protein